MTDNVSTPAVQEVEAEWSPRITAAYNAIMYASGGAPRAERELAAMVVSVMQPGGMKRGGLGVNHSQRVRLMHAAVRHLILQRGRARQQILAQRFGPGCSVFGGLRGARNLHVDESALTGESVPVGKHLEPVAQDAAVADRRCMAYAGTLVTQGQARAVVVATGANTEMGRIGRLLQTVESGSTPLLRKMEGLGRTLTFTILGVAALLFVYAAIVLGTPWDELFIAVVGLAVAAIPEGLPAVLTITLAIGVQRMAGRHAVVRRLPAVETLGSVTVICSDKTGTLTRNEMTVQQVVCDGLVLDVTGAGYAPEGTLSSSADGEPLAGEVLADRFQPDVLADRYADHRAPKHDRFGQGAGLEQADFVKGSVIG